MSKIIDHFLIPLFVVISVLYAFSSFGKEAVRLQKVYHHKADHAVHLERGNISFYFSCDPQIQELPDKKTDKCRSVFFFPHAVISSGECESMVERINQHNDGYRVTIAQVEKPVKGIELVFTIETDSLAISYHFFDSIGLSKGVVFRLYDKDNLRQLNEMNNRPILRTLSTFGKPRVVIDAGHGGHDGGAVSSNGVQEKHVTLAISRAVSNLLAQQGYDVLLTRAGDCTVSLDERTSYANLHHADFFVSIHANYAADSRAIGIETFCIKPSLFKKTVSYLSQNHQLYVDNTFKRRAECSYDLARSVQQCLCDAVAQYHNESIDRRVKFSVSQVLIGSQMPVILVEVGFLSHPKESQLLGLEEYQKIVARGICEGIISAIAC